MAVYQVVDAERLDTKLTGIADIIREKTGNKEQMTLDDMVSGVAEAYEAGRNTQLRDFWDIYQAHGNRADYRYAFAGNGWNSSLFKPVYDIVPTGSALSLFQATQISGDLRVLLKNVRLDLSKATTVTSLFNSSQQITQIGVLNISGVGASNASSVFAYCTSLETVEKLIFKELGTSFFLNCIALKNISLEGTISNNNADLHWSTLLTKDSIVSIINALSHTTSGLTATLSLVAVNNAFETATGAADGAQSAAWRTLVATRSNWNISLV